MYWQYIKESGYFFFDISEGLTASAGTDAPLAFIIAKTKSSVKGLF